MQRVVAFNNISLDGYFVDRHGSMSWAKDAADDEFRAFTRENARGAGTLVFGRLTYELMASFWPTPEAAKLLPEVAKRMNEAPKLVFSRTLAAATWNRTTLLAGDPVASISSLKRGDGAGLVILGSGTIIAQLAEHGLIDEYQFVVNPIALGAGRTAFAGIPQPLPLRLIRSRTFTNGMTLLCYQSR